MFLIALVFRLLLFLVALDSPDRVIAPDTETYTLPALNLLEGNGFSNDMAAPYLPTAHRTPLYPLFISLVFLVKKDLLLVSFAQVLLDSITVVLTYHLGLKFFPKKAAFLGGLLMALSLDSAVHSILILTETLFTLLFLASVYATVLFKEKGHYKWLLLAGLLAGMATLVRPILVLWMPVLAASLFLISSSKWTARIKIASVYSLAFVLMLSPWLLRNSQLWGTATMSTISGSLLLSYNAAALEADRSLVSPAEAKTYLEGQANLELQRRGWQSNEFLSSEYYSQMGREIILSSPVRYLFVHLRSDLNSLLPGITYLYELLGFTQGGTGTLSVLNQQGILAAIDHYFAGETWLIAIGFPFLALLVFTYLGALMQIFLTMRGRNWWMAVILILPIVYLLLLPGPPSNPRFRVPAMPYFSILAGSGLLFLWEVYWKNSSGIRLLRKSSKVT
ncbi:MAG TPA: glycosyltransferase family 39 protein [Anaerolineales bacterium]|nr:glycosyltransferase family 39 protein [Anaerolineales bacterium]HRQ91922.1 glycosyltransferase family 39 protein [Anaerolineales bacterium]